MPDLAPLHPQVVHFVIVFVLAGVALRLLSLWGRPSWAGPAATALIVLGALASIPAVKSGDDAHGPAERVPGARDAVVEHEEWGERTRNLLLLLATVELVGVALARRPDRQRAVRMTRIASSALGLVAVFFVYETGEHGGALVYEYAGGVGVRSGDPADVTRLLIAGLYHQAMQDRADGRPEEAARLIDEMRRRAGSDLGVQLLAAESLLRDRGDAQGALQIVEGADVSPTDTRMAPRFGLLRADALEALGMADSARAVVSDLVARFPANRAVQERSARVGAPGAD